MSEALKKFFAENETTVTINFSGTDYCPFREDKTLKKVYIVKIITPKASSEFHFYSPIGVPSPTVKDVFACLENCSSIASVDDFADEFCYDFEKPDDIMRVTRIYEAYCNQIHDIKKCFKSEQFVELVEICNTREDVYI